MQASQRWVNLPANYSEQSATAGTVTAALKKAIKRQDIKIYMQRYEAHLCWFRGV